MIAFPLQAERAARELANKISAVVSLPGANEEDCLRSEIATLIITHAASRSRLIPEKDHEAILQDIEDSAADAEEEILAMVARGATQPELEQAARAFIAQTEVREREAKAWLTRQSEQVWEEALSKLREMMPSTN